MDPVVVFDCQTVVPNRFALALAAAARSRALRRGARPRIGRSAAGEPDLALGEIAAGAFTAGELQPFLAGAGEIPPAALPAPDPTASRQRPAGAAATPPPRREAAH